MPPASLTGSQPFLFGPAPSLQHPVLPPPTRYQGSKRKLCKWIGPLLATLEFDSVLDAFGGTGSVAYMLKAAGKRVIYNDLLPSNEQIGIALIENDGQTLSPGRTEELLSPAVGNPPPSFIADTFGDVYFTDEENAWLDRTVHRIRALPDRLERAIAWYALFQSAIAKRPYNLFHRRNLYMRTADVPRSFGNKRTWDKSFEAHFRAFVQSANGALTDGGGSCRAMCGDAMNAPTDVDLVYIDPPYIARRGVGVDYAQFYHFLDGVLDYDNWAQRIDRTSKHLKLRREPNPWTSPNQIHSAFSELLDRFAASILVVSYRSDGIPSIEELERMLRRVKRRVEVQVCRNYQYALSKNRKSAEVLLIGT